MSEHGHHASETAIADSELWTPFRSLWGFLAIVTLESIFKPQAAAGGGGGGHH